MLEIKENICEDYTNICEFEDIINDLVHNDMVLKMKNYKQHYETSCFEHCKMVSYYCYLICKKYNLDYISAARAGMLHDLFLYDWRIRENGRKGLHAFTHPKTALENSLRLFNLNEKECDIILKHMWPVTFFSFPKYKESFIITLVDKYCAIKESIKAYKSRKKLQVAYRYAYVFLSMFILLR